MVCAQADQQLGSERFHLRRQVRQPELHCADEPRRSQHDHSQRKSSSRSLRVFFQGLKQAAVAAQYGASQGFDTDDGSSWYDIHDNFMFQADGWKMVSAGSDRFGDALLSSTQHSAPMVVSWTGLRRARLVFPRQRRLPRPRRRPELRQRRHFPARPRRGLV